MLFMDDGILFENEMGDGSTRNKGLFDKLLPAGTRILTRRLAFHDALHQTEEAERGKSDFQRHILELYIPDRSREISQAMNMIVQKDGFPLCRFRNTSAPITFNKETRIRPAGGEGFILQKLQGDGSAFVHAGGTVIERTLNNETLRVDTGCVVAFESQIDFDVRRLLEV